MSDEKAVPSPPERRGIDFGKLAWGVVLVGFGMLLLLDRLDLLYLERYWRYWPLILVALGVISLAGARTVEKRRSALWLLGIGLWLLVNTLELFGFWWNDSWPLVVMLAGVVDLVQPKRRGSRWGGVWPLAIGFWLLVNVRELWGFSWDDSWPLILIVVGALLVIRAVGEGWWGWRPRKGECDEC